MNNDTFLPKTAAVFSVLAILANVAAMSVGISQGGRPPHLIDFGDGEQLAALATNRAALIPAYVLGLLSPCFGVVPALGWHHVLKRAGSYAFLGVAMYLFGMTFVVLLDVLELTLFSELPALFAAAPEQSRAGVLAVGATLGSTRDVLGHVGHFFGFGLAKIAFALAIFKTPGVPNWLGCLLLVPAVTIGWLATPLKLSGNTGLAGLMIMIGMPCFFLWMICMAFILWRWRPEN